MLVTVEQERVTEETVAMILTEMLGAHHMVQHLLLLPWEVEEGEAIERKVALEEGQLR